MVVPWLSGYLATQPAMSITTATFLGQGVNTPPKVCKM